MMAIYIYSKVQNDRPYMKYLPVSALLLRTFEAAKMTDMVPG
jgi:hypothetical protein